MVRPPTELGSLRLSRLEKERLLMALLFSLLIHLCVWGGYEAGKKIGLWQKWHLFRHHPMLAQVKKPLDTAQPTVFVLVSQLAENWPDELKVEISDSGFSNLKVPLAGADVAAGLKRGRVTMPWKQLRILTKPGSPASLNDHLELELPLKVVAPLYFAAQKNGQRAQKNTTVTAEIPNQFFGYPPPAPATPRAPTTQGATVSPLKRASKRHPGANLYAKADSVKTPSKEDNLYAPPANSTLGSSP